MKTVASLLTILMFSSVPSDTDRAKRVKKPPFDKFVGLTSIAIPEGRLVLWEYTDQTEAIVRKNDEELVYNSQEYVFVYQLVSRKYALFSLLEKSEVKTDEVYQDFKGKEKKLHLIEANDLARIINDHPGKFEFMAVRFITELEREISAD